LLCKCMMLWMLRHHMLLLLLFKYLLQLLSNA
jgi:hypothetical protein